MKGLDRATAFQTLRIKTSTLVLVPEENLEYELAWMI